MKDENESPDMLEVITQMYEEAEKEPSSEDVVPEEKESPDSTIVETKQTDEEVKEKEEKETAKPEEDDKSKDEKKEPEEDIKIPTHIPPYVKDVLEGKDNETKKSILEMHSKMVSSMQNKSRELSEHKRISENVHDVFDRYGKASVKDKVSYLENYLKFESVADKDPEVALRQMMKALKVDPEEFLNKIVYDGDKIKESDLEFENNNLKQQLSSYEQNRVGLEVKREVEDFKNEKDEQGNLKHPYLERLQGEMAKLAKIEPDLPLEKLYTKAFRLDDDLYNESLENEKSKVEKKTEDKLKVKKAKDISTQNITSRPYDTTPKGNREKLYADLDALYNNQNIGI